MTSTTQREALTVLAELSELSPEIRLGQLLAHLGFLGEAHVGRGLGVIDDDELLAVMYRHRAELVARNQGIASSNQTTGKGLSVSASATTQESLPVASIG